MIACIPRPRFCLLPALALALCTAIPAAAQEGPGHAPAGGASSQPPQGLGPIAPNRPGFTNGSATVAPGDALAENGVALARAPASQGGQETLDLPETNLRVGVTPNLEADIGLPDYYDVHGGDRGFGDGAVGVKYKFYQSRDGNTKASFAPSLSLPTRTSFSSGHTDPALLLGMQTASGARWSLASNLVRNSVAPSGARVATTTISGSVSYTLTPALSVYVDAFDVVPQTGPPASSADGGVTYLLNKNVQLDAELYVGLGGIAPVRTLAAGLSFRL
ncbi:MAG: transporter [Armatimonadetes bacterium]|nr:transporter [Armatimonadota bacterium]